MKGSLQSRRAHSVDALPTAIIAAALGIALVAFGLYATASAALGWDLSIKRPVLAACFFGAFSTFFAVVGTLAVAEAISTRFQLNGSRLIARSLWFRVDCDLSAVGSVVWSKTGAITLTADGATVTVHPDLVRRRAWRAAAISLHKALPPSIQAGWRSSRDRLVERRQRHLQSVARRSARQLTLPLPSLGAGFISVAMSLALPGSHDAAPDITSTAYSNLLLWALACGLVAITAASTGAAAVLARAPISHRLIASVAVTAGCFAAVRVWQYVSIGLAPLG